MKPRPAAAAPARARLRRTLAAADDAIAEARRVDPTCTMLLHLARSEIASRLAQAEGDRVIPFREDPLR